MKKHKKLLWVYLAILVLLCSCSTVEVPFTVSTPDLPVLDESFSSDRIITEVETVDDLMNNLLIYEGQLVYYKNVSNILYDYIADLEDLSLTVED